MNQYVIGIGEVIQIGIQMDNFEIDFILYVKMWYFDLVEEELFI